MPRSAVSTITQTPASGPFALVTTPPISSASIWTGLGVVGAGVGAVVVDSCPQATSNVIAQATITLTIFSSDVILISVPPRNFYDPSMHSGSFWVQT